MTMVTNVDDGDASKESVLHNAAKLSRLGNLSLCELDDVGMAVALNQAKALTQYHEACKSQDAMQVPPPKVAPPNAEISQGLKIATSHGQDAPLSVDVPREVCQGAASKKAPKAPKDIQPTKQVGLFVDAQGLKRTTPLKIDAPLLADVPQEPCQGGGSKKAPKAPKIATPLKIAMPPGQDAPLSVDIPREQSQGSVLKKASKAPKVPKVPKEAQPTKHVRFEQGQDDPLSSDVPQEPCQDASLKKAPAPKTPKEIRPTKHGLKIATPLKIAMREGQDAPLSVDVPREQGQGATLKKAPKGLKMATPALQDAPLPADVPRKPCQDASSKKASAPKAPMEAQPTKKGLNLVKGSCALKAQKSSQSKEVSGTVGSRLGAPKTPKAPKEDQQTKHVGLCLGLSVSARVNKGKAKADVKEKEGTTVPEQQNVKRLKKMKEVEVREDMERKLDVDEVKVKWHTGKGKLEKVPEVKIPLKRDGVKNKAKKHVEKGQEIEGPADKVFALVGSSKRPKLQVKRAKQSGASCTTSTTVVRSP
ncbi:hypothetical protein L7F22_007455 [Adiantum nelumboides]|nr:hypothetical protein [Adiantum nelumboides]